LWRWRDVNYAYSIRDTVRDPKSYGNTLDDTFASSYAIFNPSTHPYANCSGMSVWRLQICSDG
jgi:hypothetical protein